MMQAAGGALYSLDLLAAGAVNRSLALSAGFRSMLGARNFICAASILRLQLDTALRFSAAWLVEEPHGFAHDVLRGKQIRSLRDRDGKHMTDAYLVERLAVEHDWVPRVYKERSGYIHLSHKHLFNAFDGVDAEARQLAIKVSATDGEHFTDDYYIEAAEAFGAATEVLLEYLPGWVATKVRPSEATSVENHPSQNRTPNPLMQPTNADGAELR